MPEFTQLWAFIFIIGVICFAAGFVLAIILARSSKDSRMEEDWEARQKRFSGKQMVSDVEDILGRKVG